MRLARSLSCPRLFLPLLLILLLVSGCAGLTTSRPVEGETVAASGMVVTDHPAASRIGVEVMRQGGNAVDAAVAVQFALAVCFPGAGNIGGGGFAVLRNADGEIAALDFRETAPGKSGRDMYLDADGEIIPRLSLDGHLAVGVPGTVDGMARLHKRYGKRSWTDLLQLAIDLAARGYALTPRQAETLNRLKSAFMEVNAVPPPMVRRDRPWLAGDVIRQPTLARTLERIRDRGRDGFYSGETARLLRQEMARGGGLITQRDLDEYQAVWRRPVTGTYRGYRVISMPPPSSGGVALLQILYGLEAWPMHEWPVGDWRRVHIASEVERLVYADRATHLGDPDFYPVPLNRLLSDFYLQSRFMDISLEGRIPTGAISAGRPMPQESSETTHFSVVDARGNAVSITTTLNGRFGSKVMVAGAGFFLNNEMDDFSSKPGVPNQFGLIGGEANAIAPGKRMLSSMTPTIVEKGDRLFMVTGSPGGSTIITTVMQTIINVIDLDLTLAEAVGAGRTHHQWRPDVIGHEPDAIDPESQIQLLLLGHELKVRQRLGRVNAILVREDGKRVGVHDRRRGDGAASGY